MKHFLRALAAACIVSAALSTAATAQQYPSQPIKIIVSLAPGGVADITARAFAAKLGEAGVTAVVENRTGAGGAIGADAAAKSAPDGYTIYMGFHATQSILPHLTKLPYDPAKDFLPIAFVATSPNVLIVHPSVPVKTAQELVAYIKANSGKLSYGSPGLGSSGHLAGEQFKQLHNLDIAHVHYRGAAPALQDLVAGHVQVMFDIVALTKEQLEAGRVRALAVTSKAARARDPQRADHDGSWHARRRGRPVVRAVCARRHAPRRDRMDQRSGHQGVLCARPEGASDNDGTDHPARHAGGFRQARQRRNAALGRRDPQGQYQDAAIGVSHATKRKWPGLRPAISIFV